jgi:energy-coupling factor transporter ATP-binding protein EcfA2
MNQLKLLQRISQLLARFSEQVKILNANGEFSINIHAENVLIKILNELFDCKLENVNYTEKNNYPAIDLRDKKKRLSFQITSSENINKVKHTLKKFLENDLDKNYDQVYIFILTEKQSSYSQESIDKLVNGQIKFDVKSNIIDKQYIYSKLNENNDINQIKRIFQLLEEQFSDKNELTKWQTYTGTLDNYDSYLSKKFEFLGVKGFSPKINNTLVKLKLMNLYVPLRLQYFEQKVSSKQKPLEFLDELNKKNFIVLLGDPGAGKSTLLKYAALKLIEQRKSNIDFSLSIPIYIKATEYANYYQHNQKKLSEFIINHFDKKYEKIFLEALEKHQLVLLLDGLDEINDKHLRNQVIEEIEDMTCNYPESKYVITSRIVGYQELSLNQKFLHYKLMDLSSNQIAEFIHQWFINIYDDCKENVMDATLLTQSIFNKESVLKLAQNPLLLTIITLISNQGMELPKKRVQLYEIATFTFLENWVLLRKQSEEKLELTKEEIIELLTPIALYMHQNCLEGLIKEKILNKKLYDEYIKVFAFDKVHAKQKIKRILDYLREEAGFFYEKGHEQNEILFGFIHLTFQEYFSAMELANLWSDGDLKLERYLFDSNWKEVLQLSAGVLNQSGVSARKTTSKFINNILEVEDEYPQLDRPIRICCEIMADDIDLQEVLIQNILNSVYDKFLEFSHEQLHWYKNCLSSLFEHKIAQRLIIEKVKSTLDEKNLQSIVELLVSNDHVLVVQKYLEKQIIEKNSLFVESLYNNSQVYPRLNIVKTKVFQENILDYIINLDDNTAIPIQFFVSFFISDDLFFSQNLSAIQKNLSYVFMHIKTSSKRNMIIKQLLTYKLFHFTRSNQDTFIDFCKTYEDINIELITPLLFEKEENFEENSENYIQLEFHTLVKEGNLSIYINKMDTTEIYIQTSEQSSKVIFEHLKNELVHFSNNSIDINETVRLVELIIHYKNNTLLSELTIKDINLLFRNTMLLHSFYYQYDNDTNLFPILFDYAFKLINTKDDYLSLIKNVNLETLLRISQDGYKTKELTYIGSEDFIKKINNLPIVDIYKAYILYKYCNYSFEQIRVYIDSLLERINELTIQQQSIYLKILDNLLALRETKK